MKVLVGVVDIGEGKAYARAKFDEMARACIEGPGVDIVFFANREHPRYNTIVTDFYSNYAEDMLTAGREEFRRMAIVGEYDRMVWQGIDAFFRNRDDFERLLNHNVDVVAPLISARQWEDEAVARRFLRLGSRYLEEQVDIPHAELLGDRELVPSGFPGADNIVIDRRLFYIDFKGHVPWYVRHANGETNICVEEFWCLQALNRGYNIFVDTRCKVWHVHEDHTARMFKGITKRLEDLSW